ncbi:TonB-dependent receptor [Alteraurantiacibacter aquimixticola]|uniref:TonB-dependent receptor n=1 Tax=Alteraurantiacibacter aquimixticola TaxID=2489173 RepID=A0A4T3EX59_9SPHN|nr:TonB-dependent receptor [Alteraurantiacibacter aquimixticola]TIX49048.1 TonB-dependent receptor [Alteraurantiacibacter aquimixticola]
MKFKTLSVASSLAIMASMAAPAYAQDDGDDDGRNNVIVVTAEFREAALQDTPIAITAVNAEMLEARGQTDIAQIAAQAPNVSLRPQPQNGGSGLIAFIRGVGQVDFNYALDPGVGVYVDDVYIPTLSSSLLELIDLDRIEVLRGPQGTLAGKNSIGGAIKLFSAKPRGDDSGSLRVEYGSYDMIQIRGMADFGITDNLAVRISGMSRSRDGYVDMLEYSALHDGPDETVPANLARGIGNENYETMGGENITAGRIALRWEPTDRLEINISGDYTREASEATPTVLIAAGASTPSGVSSEFFDPFSQNPSVSAGSMGEMIPWLEGTDGQPVLLDCRFVPAGPYSCDTANLEAAGYDPRFVSYSNFMDAMDPNPQAPFKPYFALPIKEFEGWGIQGNLTYDISDNLQFVYIGSYRAYESKWGQDQDATPIPVAQLDNQLNHEAWSSEVRLNFDAADGLLQGTVGGFYLDQDGEYTARVDLNYVNPTIDFIHGPDTTPSTTKALFGTVTLRPTDAFSLTGGLRYTKDKKVYTYFRRNPDGSQPDGFNCFVANGPYSEPNCLLAGLFDIPGEFKGDRWDWRIVGDYRFSDQFLAYASVSTGFKGGGVNPRPFVADQALEFQPETLTTYEVGFKSDFLDRRVRLNGAAFINKYEDIILQKLVCPESSLPSPCLRPENIGSADVKGLELELGLFPVDGLSIDGSIALLDFEYTSPSVPGNTQGCPAAACLEGTSIPADGITPYTPELTYSFGIQYDHEIESGTISGRFDGSYQSDVFANSENTSWAEVEGRFLGNARLSYTTADEDWRVSLEVENLFNKYYFLSRSDVASNALGVVTGVPAMPRTWSVAVERRF